MVRLVCFTSLFLFSLAACTSEGSMSPGDDDPRPDAPPMMSQLDPADCTLLAQSAATAATACGTALPSGAQAQLETWCKKGVTKAALCGGNPGGGLDCFASPDPNDWVCALGDIYPACNGDLGAALGAYCLIALGNPACASGIACSYNSDCSNGSSCNNKTGQCMSDTAYCVGLPCAYNSDCPQGEMCNSTEGACVIE